MNNNILEAWMMIAETLDSVNADDEALMALMCTVVDVIAGKMDKHGYELIEDVLPIMREVGGTLGICR